MPTNKTTSVKFRFNNEEIKLYRKWTKMCDDNGLIYKKRVAQLMAKDLENGVEKK